MPDRRQVRRSITSIAALASLTALRSQTPTTPAHPPTPATHPTAGQIAGLVVDELEQPVPNVKVGFYDEWHTLHGTALTNAAGWFTRDDLPLHGQVVVITLEAPRFARASHTVTLRAHAPRRTIHARLRTAETIRGRVCGPDGAPVVGASVWLPHDGAGIQAPPAHAVTDAAGRFTLPGLPLGRSLMLVEAASFGVTCQPVLTPSDRAIDIVLRTEGSRRITVQVDGPAQTHDWRWRLRTRTRHGWIALGDRPLSGARGEIRGVPSDWPNLEVTVLGRERATTATTASPTSRTMILAAAVTKDAAIATLPPREELSGRVVDIDGRPLAGFALEARGAQHFSPLAITDAEGEFRMPDPSGAGEPVELFAATRGYRLHNSSGGNVDDGLRGRTTLVNHTPVTLVALPVPTLRGTLVDRDGTPLPAVGVALFAANPEHFAASCTTDRHGRFEFARAAIADIDVILRAGVAKATVSVGPFRPGTDPIEPIVMRAKRIILHDFAVQDRDGRAVPGAALVLGHRETTAYHTDRDGRCRVTCLGMVQPILLDEHGAPTEAQVTMQGTDTQLRWVLRRAK